MSDDEMETTATELCQSARLLWLSADDDDDKSRLKRVEELYRRVWTRQHADSKQDSPKADKKRRLEQAQHSAAVQEAGEKLALLLLQSKRTAQADEILGSLGYSCRLAAHVLDYPTTSTTTTTSQVLSSSSTIPCRIHDNFLTPIQAEILRNVFCDPSASYWKDNNYSVEPPSPYFSYLIPLKQSQDFGFIGQLAQQILELATSWKPIVRRANYCELWAHNRPHASGHQLHFDSDNEGAGGIKNPIVSSILYLGSAGGPSLITNQRLSSSFLADKGWLCMPLAHRLVVFDGKVLHGVIPGIEGSGRRRVTVMMAFWSNIQERNEGGAAQKFPSRADWAQTLLQPVPDSRPQVCETEPITLDCVYERVQDGKPSTRSMGLPNYEQVFQGF